MTFFECRKSSIVYCWCPVLSCLTLCNSTDCSTPGFPVLHHLPELLKLMFIESGVPSRPLLPSSPPALNLFQHQGLFQWIGSLHQVVNILELQFSISPSNEHPDWSPLGMTSWISLQCKGLSWVFSKTTVQKHQFFCAQLSLQSNCYIHTWLLEKT